MKKNITIAVIALVLILFTVGKIPSVFSSELTSPEKTLTILRDVVCLDIAVYETSLDLHSQILDYRGLPQEDVKYTFDSDKSKLEIICTFVNEKLRSMNIYRTEGIPLITQQSTSTLEMAEDILYRYQTYSNNSYFSKMRSMLDNIVIDKNITKISENIKLEVKHTKSYTSFKWKYTFNGIDAPSKCVVIKFEQGYLKYFIDSWSLYSIGSTDLCISEENAIEIAMNATENYSWNVSMGEDPQITVTDFDILEVSETKLTIGNYPTKNESREGDPLTLYPMWHIKLCFDKSYPGQVYGLNVGLWADTGEVKKINTMLLLGDFSSNEDVSIDRDHVVLTSNEEIHNLILNIPLLTSVALLMSIILGVTIAYSKKKHGSCGIWIKKKFCSSEFRGTLLFLSLLFTMLPMTITFPTVKAGTYVMPLYGANYNLTTDESSAAHSVINYWESKFDAYADYTVYDYFGSGTQKQTILDNADDFEDDYDHVAMFHYGHGGMHSVHRDYCDNDGWGASNEIWDYEVWPETTSSKHFFVVIWSCRQGDYIGGYHNPYCTYGMPYNWFHGNPSSGDCFIGFKDASMPLTQESDDNPFYTYDVWVKRVGFRLTYSHDTVIQALDSASNTLFDLDFDETELAEGFTAEWPAGSGPGQMKVYGNWNIKVY